MATTPQSDYACGTDAPGWLNGAHPLPNDGVVSRQVCFAWSYWNGPEDSCRWSYNVDIVACNGFYLYNLSGKSLLFELC
jgi:hypothetical protein